MSPHGSKDPTLAAAMSGLLGAARRLKDVCSSASVVISNKLRLVQTYSRRFTFSRPSFDRQACFVVHFLPTETVYVPKKNATEAKQSVYVKWPIMA